MAPYPFIQAEQHGPAANLPVSRIVIHGTVSPCRVRQARTTAAYFQTVTRPASAHYVVDPGEIIQCLSEMTIGYHAPPNAHSIGIELCDPQTGPGSRWADADHEAMLARAAGLVRELAAKHGIPLVKLSPADLLAGKSGICGHVDVTNAWHQTTHVDPGPDFPWAHFLDLIRTPVAPQEDTLSAAEVQQINDYTRALLLDGYTINGQAKPSLLAVLTETQRRTTAALAQVGALQATVTELAKGGSLTPAEVQQAAQAGADAALAKLGEKLGGA